MSLDPDRIRAQFPALASGAVFLDSPGGTQVPQRVVDRMTDYLLHSNANHGGAFPTSRQSDAILDQAHQAVAALYNAASPDEIVFGPNMTTLTLAISRSLALQLGPGDEIVVTRLDHDANISPWLLVAEDRGCTIRWWDFDVEDCTLKLDQLESLLSDHTKIVALGYASNAVGTINPIKPIVQMAHDSGALCYVDAVQFAPHGVIDVQALDCDFLVASAYKFFGPHVGALYGKSEHLNALRAYKVRPAPDTPPGKFETGTQNHEGLAGTLGALEYLAWTGQSDATDSVDTSPTRAALVSALNETISYETELTVHLLEVLTALPGVHVYGLTEPDAMDRRVPTVSIRMDGLHPRLVAEALAEKGLYVWDGNFYALAVTQRLGIEDEGGLIRIGLAHYNTHDEIDRLGYELGEIRRSTAGA
jgi:cysteine desulfurase family protein (TIGR01976 family)